MSGVSLLCFSRCSRDGVCSTHLGEARLGQCHGGGKRGGGEADGERACCSRGRRLALAARAADQAACAAGAHPRMCLAHTARADRRCSQHCAGRRACEGQKVSRLSDTSAHVIALRKARGRTAWAHPWPMATDMDDALMRALADMDPANRGPEAAAPQGAEEEEDDTADVAPGEDGGPEAGPPGEAGEDGAEGEQVAQPEGEAPGDAPAEQGDAAEGVPAGGDEQGAPPMEEWKKEQLRCVFGAVQCRWPPGFCSCPSQAGPLTRSPAPGPPAPGPSCPCWPPSRRWGCWTPALPG